MKKICIRALKNYNERFPLDTSVFPKKYGEHANKTKKEKNRHLDHHIGKLEKNRNLLNCISNINLIKILNSLFICMQPLKLNDLIGKTEKSEFLKDI